MSKIGIYPGTFDPMTNGHLNIIKRSLKIVDMLIIGVADNQNKTPLLSIEERKEIIENDLKVEKLDNSKITILSVHGLLTEFAKSHNANCIIRGLRAVSDFEYEFLMTGMNRSIDNEIETIFLMSSEKYHFISSRFIKEIHSLGGDISKSVPKPVLDFFSKIWDVHIFYTGP